MAGKILYRFGIHLGMNKVRNEGVSEQMRGYLKIKTIYDFAVVKGCLTQNRVHRSILRWFSRYWFNRVMTIVRISFIVLSLPFFIVCVFRVRAAFIGTHADGAIPQDKRV